MSLNLEGRAWCAQSYSIYTREIGAGWCTVSVPPAVAISILNHQRCLLHLAHCVWLKHTNSSMRWPSVMPWIKPDDQGFSGAHDRRQHLRGPRKMAWVKVYSCPWNVNINDYLCLKTEKWIVWAGAVHPGSVRSHILNYSFFVITTSICHNLLSLPRPSAATKEEWQMEVK